MTDYGPNWNRGRTGKPAPSLFGGLMPEFDALMITYLIDYLRWHCWTKWRSN